MGSTLSLLLYHSCCGLHSLNASGRISGKIIPCFGVLRIGVHHILVCDVVHSLCGMGSWSEQTWRGAGTHWRECRIQPVLKCHYHSYSLPHCGTPICNCCGVWLSECLCMVLQSLVDHQGLSVLHCLDGEEIREYAEPLSAAIVADSIDCQKCCVVKVACLLD